MTTDARRHYRNPEDSFSARTEPLVGDPGCLLWMGGLNARGYGVMTAGGKHVLAHRYAWERVNGPIPEGMLCDHVCYVPSCVNVDHLRLATPAQNASNRKGSQPGRKHDLPRGVYPKGSRYAARVKRGGIHRNLGTFPTIEQASEAAINARAVMFGIYAGGAN